MVENNAFSGPNPQVFPTGPSVAIYALLSLPVIIYNMLSTYEVYLNPDIIVN